MKNKSYGIGNKGKKGKNLVDYYFSRLEFWKKEKGLKGYTQEIFKKAQEDI